MKLDCIVSFELPIELYASTKRTNMTRLSSYISYRVHTATAANTKHRRSVKHRGQVTAD